MLKEIVIKANGHEMTLYMLYHFMNRLADRLPKVKETDLPDILLNSMYVSARPNKLKHLLKHDLKNSFYLWNEKKKLVIVVEENEKTHKINVLKTVYPSSSCYWIEDWSCKNTYNSRKTLAEVLKELNV